MTSTYASRARKLNSIMRRVSSLLEDLKALQNELPVPSASEFEEMLNQGEYTFDAFYLGYVGALDFHLDEAVNAIWSWLRRYRPSKYPRRFLSLPDSFLEQVKRAVGSLSAGEKPAPIRRSHAQLRKRLLCLEELPERAQSDIASILDTVVKVYFEQAADEVEVQEESQQDQAQEDGAEILLGEAD